MEFNDLQIFIHLSDTKNFAKTATQNHMSPSTLSRQIQRLEDELGKTLFIRDNRQNLLNMARNFYNLLKQNGKTGNNLNNNLKMNPMNFAVKLNFFALSLHLIAIFRRYLKNFASVILKWKFS